MKADENTDETSEQITEDDEHRPPEKESSQRKDEQTKETERLHLKDWIAIIIAALQTILLPVVLLLGFLVILALIIAILF